MKYIFIAIAILSMASKTMAAVAFDASSTAGSVTGGSSLTTTGSTAASTTGLLVLYIVQTAGTVSSVSGGASVTWTNAHAHTLNGGGTLTVYQGLTTTKQTTQTITVNLSGSANAVCWWDGYSGADTTSPLEAFNDVDFTAGSGSISGSVSTLSNNALVVSAVGHTSGAFAVPNMTSGTGFTNTTNKAVAATVSVAGYGNRANAVTSSPTSVNTLWTESGTPTLKGAITSVSIKPLVTVTHPNYVITF